MLCGLQAVDLHPTDEGTSARGLIIVKMIRLVTGLVCRRAVEVVRGPHACRCSVGISENALNSAMAMDHETSQ